MKTYPQSKSTKTCYEPGDDLFTRIEKTSETFSDESLCSDGTENKDDTTLDSGEQKENEYVAATATTENSVFTPIVNTSPPLYNSTLLTHLSRAYSNLHSPDIVPLLQQQQALLQQLITQQELFRVKQHEFATKLENTEDRLGAVEIIVQEKNSSSSQDRGKNRIARDLSVSITVYTHSAYN